MNAPQLTLADVREYLMGHRDSLVEWAGKEEDQGDYATSKVSQEKAEYIEKLIEVVEASQ